jgi:hypothetical protein
VDEALNDATRPALRLTTFAILDVPFAGGRHVVANEMPLRLLQSKEASEHVVMTSMKEPLSEGRSKRMSP